MLKNILKLLILSFLLLSISIFVFSPDEEVIKAYLRLLFLAPFLWMVIVSYINCVQEIFGKISYALISSIVVITPLLIANFLYGCGGMECVGTYIVVPLVSFGFFVANFLLQLLIHYLNNRNKIGIVDRGLSPREIKTDDHDML